jgi:VWFA-related protein
VNIRTAITLLWVPLAFAPVSVSAQATIQTGNSPATPPASPSSIFTANTTLVLVPALVRTKSGELVFTLKADDFILTDNGIEQKLSLEEDTDDQPLALVVAVETGGAGARQLDKLRNIGSLIEAVVGNVRHQVAVVGFDSQPRLLQDFSPKMNDVADAIQGLTPGDKGAAILDGLNYSVDLLRRQPPEYRRAVLLISETIDRGSHIKLDQAVRAISDTNTAIYSLGFSSPKSDVRRYASEELPTVWNGGGLSNPNPQHPGGCMAKDPNADPGTSQNKLSQAYDCLGQLAPPLAAVKMAVIAAMEGMRRNAPETVAHLTGGEFYLVDSPRSIERDLMTLANHVPNRYVLSFHPQSPAPGPHSIELRLSNYSNLVVTARTSYWVDSAAFAPNPTADTHP